MHFVEVATLDAADARALVDAVKQCVRSNRHGPVSVSVVDAHGGILLVERMDGALPHTVEAAIRKAKTAVALQCDTAELVDTAQWPIAELIGLMAVLPEATTWKGGVLLLAPGGQVVGALAAHGAKEQEHNREACVYARSKRGLANKSTPVNSARDLPFVVG